MTKTRASRILFAAVFLLTALLAAALACAEQAEDIAPACKLRATENHKTRKYVLTSDFTQRWQAGRTGELTVTLPEGKTSQGIMVTHYLTGTPLDVVDGEGRLIGHGPGKYLIEWIPFEKEAAVFSIRAGKDAKKLDLSRLNVLTPGELPRWVQRWETLDGPAELMLVSTHPDDEILWFGGILPYYAGQLRRKVIVVYMVGALKHVRNLELLDGLWRMGVTVYPDVGDFHDVGKYNIGSVYDHWGRNGAEKRLVEAIRRYRPQVVITQDVNGEYGHKAHVVTVQAVTDIFDGRLSGNPEKYPESAAKYGVWMPLKLYIHLWKEGQIRFDWQQPLSAFDGETGLEVAKAAFKKHVSQQNGKYSVRDSGFNDCSLFGLYWSSVGPDEEHNDLFEHVPPLE